MSIIVSNCQHCDEQQFQTMSMSLHDFLSSKVRFIHTSTVTGSDSCSGKNYAYILLLLILRTNISENKVGNFIFYV